MTDRINGILVVLEEDIRSDETEPILNALRCIRGVLRVEPNVADAEAYIAESRARTELVKELHAVLMKFARV